MQAAKHDETPLLPLILAWLHDRLGRIVQPTVQGRDASEIAILVIESGGAPGC